jgi:hypothetical protein
VKIDSDEIREYIECDLNSIDSATDEMKLEATDMADLKYLSVDKFYIRDFR